MIKVFAIRCAKCGEIIYSRAIHDFHRCSCKIISIDSRFDCVKVDDNRKDFLDIFIIKIDSTRIDLYNDWYYKTNKYGKISIDEQIQHSLLPKMKFIERSFIQKRLKRKWFFKCSCGCKFKNKLSSRPLVKCPKCGFIGDTWIIN